MKFTLVVCVALLGLVSAVSLKPALQPERANFRFVQLWNRPEATQDYQRGEDEAEQIEHGVPDSAISEVRWGHEGTQERKTTPGKSCRAYPDCMTCAAVTPCIWIPNDPHDTANKWKNGEGHCTEERAQGDDEPNSGLGERLYECKIPHAFEVVDTPDDELDDYSDLHINGSPTHTDIAVLDKAEPVYTVAQELGVGEGPESESAGDWLVGGNTHEDYEGYHDETAIAEAHGNFRQAIEAEEAEAAAGDR